MPQIALVNITKKRVYKEILRMNFFLINRAIFSTYCNPVNPRKALTLMTI